MLVNAYRVCNTDIKFWDSKMNRASEQEASVAIGLRQPAGFKRKLSTSAAFSNRFWRMTVLAAAGAIGMACPAEAAIYWSDSDTGFSHPGPPPPQRGQQARRHQGKKTEVPGKQAAKPQGPLIIAISIRNQNLRIYDANGFFAETPISTGMAGHPTPMGVFSVIQKQKLHHSNIYSGAPMPYMQRITWSGIAIHAGVLPGYPASHGCIRMPMAFAVKMWGWTKMGARVVIAPGELSPASFSHPLLAAQKLSPQPVAAAEPKADVLPVVKSGATPDADGTTRIATSEPGLELRSTVGHEDGGKPAIDDPAATAPLREQTHTADAGELSAAKAPVTMSDATSPRDDLPAAAEPDAGAAHLAVNGASAKTGDAPKPDTSSDVGASRADPTTPGRTEAASPEPRAAAGKSAEAAVPEIRSAGADAADPTSKRPDGVQAPADGAAAISKAIASDSRKADDASKSAEKSNEKPTPGVKAAIDSRVTVGDEKKDQTRLPDTEKAAGAKPDPAMAAGPKRSGQISVFVSRKDSKLYVRQNFAPLFDVPITIAPSDRPLGTHVFTAQVDPEDANRLHWSVISLPAPARRDEDERASRRRRIAGAAEIKPLPQPDSPAEALDRLAIPADAMARITDALSTGASIIVSDQGIAAGETGEGTDFIVSLR